MINATLRWLLAPVCAACRAPLLRPLASPVCDACWCGLPRLTEPLCAGCGDQLPGWRAVTSLCARCRRAPRAFANARSAGRYDGSLRDIVHAFKYEKRRVLAAPLAALMREAGAELLGGADAVVPVPLHPWRLWQRGFNQADDLARHLGPPVWRILRRRRHGPPQASLPAGRRHANVRDAYALGHLARYRDIRACTVVLVDDVMTTGATMEACARVLVEEGARRVGALTVARAVAGRLAPPRPSPDLSADPRR